MALSYVCKPSCERACVRACVRVRRQGDLSFTILDGCEFIGACMRFCQGYGAGEESGVVKCLCEATSVSACVCVRMCVHAYVCA